MLKESALNLTSLRKTKVRMLLAAADTVFNHYIMSPHLRVVIIHLITIHHQIIKTIRNEIFSLMIISQVKHLN